IFRRKTTNRTIGQIDIARPAHNILIDQTTLRISDRKRIEINYPYPLTQCARRLIALSITDLESPFNQLHCAFRCPCRQWCGFITAIRDDNLNTHKHFTIRSEEHTSELQSRENL